MTPRKVKIMNAFRRPAVALLAVSTCVALITGCSAGAPDPAGTATVAERESGVLGVRMCVTNKTTEVAKVEWLTSDRAEVLDKNLLRVGKTACAEGWRSSLLENDVRVKVTWPDRLAQEFTAWNQVAGEPQVRVDASKESAAEACGFEVDGMFDVLIACSDGYAVNDSRAYRAYDYHETIVKRVADSAQNKEFVMTLVK